MTRLALRTQGQSYGVKFGQEVIGVQLDGGRPKNRRDILNASKRVSVEWILNTSEYDYIMAFYRTTTVSGSLPFTIDLVIDSQTRAVYTASFVPGSFQLASKAGDTFRVTADLDVDAVTPDATADAALVSAFNAAHPV
jgi:hypothetical protein